MTIPPPRSPPARGDATPGAESGGNAHQTSIGWYRTDSTTDSRLTDYAVRLYLHLCRQDAWRVAIRVTTRALAGETSRSIRTVRTALRQLEAAGYISRHIRGRAQIVRALHWSAHP